MSPVSSAEDKKALLYPPPYNEVDSTYIQQPATNPNYSVAIHQDSGVANTSAISSPDRGGGSNQAPVTQQPVVIQMANPNSAAPYFGPRYVCMTCPHCQQLINTETSSEHKCLATVCCCLMCCSLCCTLFSCIPYCMDSFKIVHHRCPNCKTRLGVFTGSI